MTANPNPHRPNTCWRCKTPLPDGTSRLVSYLPSFELCMNHRDQLEAATAEVTAAIEARVEVSQ